MSEYNEKGLDCINFEINAITPHPRNTEFFSNIEGEEFERLKESIAEKGIITPIIVSPDMTIISGHQRYRAAKELGLRVVPIIIDRSIESEDDKLSKLIASNFQRTSNDPIKKAHGIVEYEKLRGVRQGSAFQKADGNNSRQVSQEDIAAELGVSSDTIQNMKKLLKLNPQLQKAISEGRIKQTVGYKTLATLNEDEQQQLVNILPEDKKLSQKEIEKFILKIKGELFPIPCGKFSTGSKEKAMEPVVRLPVALNTIYCHENEINEFAPTTKAKKDIIVALCEQMEKNVINLVGMVQSIANTADVTLGDILEIRSVLSHIPNVPEKLDAALEEKTDQIL